MRTASRTHFRRNPRGRASSRAADRPRLIYLTSIRRTSPDSRRIPQEFAGKRATRPKACPRASNPSASAFSERFQRVFRRSWIRQPGAFGQNFCGSATVATTRFAERQRGSGEEALVRNYFKHCRVYLAILREGRQERSSRSPVPGSRESVTPGNGSVTPSFVRLPIKFGQLRGIPDHRAFNLETLAVSAKFVLLNILLAFSHEINFFDISTFVFYETYSWVDPRRMHSAFQNLYILANQFF